MVEYKGKAVVNNFIEKLQVPPALLSNVSIVLCGGVNVY